MRRLLLTYLADTYQLDMSNSHKIRLYFNVEYARIYTDFTPRLFRIYLIERYTFSM